MKFNGLTNSALRGLLKASGYVLAVVLMAGILGSCKVKYSFSGASISPEAKTVSIAHFPNNAAMVSPVLSVALTDALKDKFSRQTRLAVVREGGDLAFEGEITGYTSVPAAITGDAAVEENRLTITVRVRFTNSKEPHWNFEKTFTSYAQYPAITSLQEAEGSKIPEIVEKLVDDIFNAAVANW